MKKFLLTLCLLISCAILHAATATVNGIQLTYTVTSGKATITKCSTSSSGNLIIPSTLGGYPVASIGNYAFYGCAGLTSVTIPEGVTSIESNAFSGCTGLSYLSIPLSVTDIQPGTFKGVAPETIQAVEVPFVNGDAFLGSLSKSNLKTIIIPEGATTIPQGAFRGAENVTTVKIPASVTTVESNAFYGVAPTYLEAPFLPNSMDGKKVKTIVVPNEVKSLKDKAFWGCTNVSSITLPPMISVASGAFNNVTPETLVAPFCPSSIVKTNLKTVEVPEGVTSLSSSFADAPKLTSVKLPSTLTKILSNAFRNCTSLPSITIPEGVESIGSYAFSGCSSLTSVTIPSSVTEIGDDVFAECPNLPKDANGFQYESVNQRLLICAPKTLSGSITLPESVCLISNQAFSKCTGITSIRLPSRLIYMGPEVFSECTNLVRVDLPTSLKKIPDGAFNNCTQLKTVTIPKGIIEIGKKAFYNCGAMESITLPSSVKWFQENAFELCNGLKAVHISDIEVWATSYFKNRSANPLVYASYLYVNGELLKHLEFSTYVGRIGAYAFAGCLSLQSVILDALLIEEYAFWGCPDLNFVQLNDATGLNTIEVGDCAFESGGSGYVKTFVFNCLPPKANWSCFDRIGYGYCLSKYGFSWANDMSSDNNWYGLQMTITDFPPSLGNKITFNANGGSGGRAIRLLPGAKLTAPTVIREGYTFVGWEPAAPETAPGTSTTYTAQWKANGSGGDTPSVVLYTITFNANGGTGGKTVKQAAGTPLTAPTVTRPGHIFVGWNPEVPKVVPLEARTYTAKWKKFEGEWADIGFVRGKSNSNSHAFIDEFYTNNPSLEDELGRCTVIGLPKGITFKQRDYPDDLEFSISGKTNVPVGDYPVLFQFEDSSYISAKIKVRDPLPSFTATYKSTTKEVPVGWDYGDCWPMATKANVDVEYQVVNGELKKIKYKSSYLDNEYGSWNREYEISNTKYRAVITRDGKEAIAMAGSYDYPTRGGVEYEDLYAAILFWDDNTVTGGVGYDYEDTRGNIYIIEGHGNWGGAPIEVECTSYFGVENIGSGSGKTTHSGTVALGNSVTLKATADKGSLFAGWYSDPEGQRPLKSAVDYRTTSLSHTITNAFEKVYAKFVTAEEDHLLTLTVKGKEITDGSRTFMVDGPSVLTFDVGSNSLPKVSVKGLPAGMKFTAKPVMVKGSKTEVEYPANSIYGTPTKPGIYTVTVSLTNTTVKKAVTKTFEIEVPNLKDDSIQIKDSYNLTVGESYNEPMTGAAGCTVTGLPAGMKWTAKDIYKKGSKTEVEVFANSVYGVPTKSGNYTVYFTKTVGKVKHTATATFIVKPEEVQLKIADEDWAKQEFVKGQPLTEICLTTSATSSVKTVTATKLPAGLKVVNDGGVWKIIGTPTTPGNYNVTLTLTTAMGTKQTLEIPISVALLPSWVMGSYYCDYLENAWWCEDCEEWEYAYGYGRFEIDALGNVGGEIHLWDDSSYTYADINSKATVNFVDDMCMLRFTVIVYTDDYEEERTYCEGRFTFEAMVSKDGVLTVSLGSEEELLNGDFLKE